jgi:glutaconate CoA-transferase subunit B
VTTKCVLRFPPDGGEAYLASVHPGVSEEEVRAETGWSLKSAPDLAQTPAPSDAELSWIRRLDPDGHWTQ